MNVTFLLARFWPIMCQNFFSDVKFSGVNAFKDAIESNVLHFKGVAAVVIGNCVANKIFAGGLAKFRGGDGFAG